MVSSLWTKTCCVFGYWAQISIQIMYILMIKEEKMLFYFLTICIFKIRSSLCIIMTSAKPVEITPSRCCAVMSTKTIRVINGRGLVKETQAFSSWLSQFTKFWGECGGEIHAMFDFTRRYGHYAQLYLGNHRIRSAFSVACMNLIFALSKK